MLVNDKIINYDSDFRNPDVAHYTEMHRLPFSLDFPQQTTVTFARNEFLKPPNDIYALFGLDPGSIEFISLQPENGV